IPSPKVPVVTEPCKADGLQIDAGKREVKLQSATVTVSIDTVSGALTFSSKDGTPILAEAQDGGKAFNVPSVFETKFWQVQQTFLSPADEALYGLGQHQEGIFDVRG